MNLALVGCGRITQLVHLDAIARLQGAQLVALAEVDPNRLMEAARRVPGATTFTDYRDLIARSDADAVVITLPPAMHAEAAVAAFEAGKHVYLEKPLAITIGGAQLILDAGARSGKVGMVGFNYRFHPLYRSMREQIQARRIGTPLGVRSVFCGSARALPPWKTARSSGGGAMLDLASHHIDLIRFLLGQEITEVTAQLRSVRTEDDTATLQMRLEGGVLAQTFVSINAAEVDRIEIVGDGGELVADRYRETRVIFTPQVRPAGRLERIVDGVRWLAATPLHALARVKLPREDSHRAALQSFVDAVGTGGPTPIAMSEGVRSLAVVLAAEASARSGRSVPLRGTDS